MTNVGAAYQNAEFLLVNNELTFLPLKAVPDHKVI